MCMIASKSLELWLIPCATNFSPSSQARTSELSLELSVPCTTTTGSTTTMFLGTRACPPCWGSTLDCNPVGFTVLPFGPQSKQTVPFCHSLGEVKLRSPHDCSPIIAIFSLWRDTLTNQVSTNILKEQKVWRRAVEIFDWFHMERGHELNVIHYN
jgi:hypothetical protein